MKKHFFLAASVLGLALCVAPTAQAAVSEKVRATILAKSGTQTHHFFYGILRDAMLDAKCTNAMVAPLLTGDLTPVKVRAFLGKVGKDYVTRYDLDQPRLDKAGADYATMDASHRAGATAEAAASLEDEGGAEGRHEAGDEA